MTHELCQHEPIHERARMADYYPLIAKTAMGLQTAQERRALSERDRDALLAELEAFKPPLLQSTVKRELIAFDEAVRKVEAEIARRAQDSG
jgi:hypothetical protein